MVFACCGGIEDLPADESVYGSPKHDDGGSLTYPGQQRRQVTATLATGHDGEDLVSGTQ